MAPAGTSVSVPRASRQFEAPLDALAQFVDDVPVLNDLAVVEGRIAGQARDGRFDTRQAREHFRVALTRRGEFSLNLFGYPDLSVGSADSVRLPEGIW
jgi:hypothetical protein